MKAFVRLLLCFLTVILIVGCGPTKAPTAPPAAANTQNPLETKMPCVNITVSNPTVKVGEVVSVVGALVNVTNPHYFGLEVRDQGADDASLLVNLLALPIRAADVSQVVTMASGTYADGKAVLGLEARKAGETTVDFFVSAEDFCGTPLGSGTSPSIKITVNP